MFSAFLDEREDEKEEENINIDDYTTTPYYFVCSFLFYLALEWQLSRNMR